MNEMNDLCPECGAGLLSGGICRLPDGYPFNADCPTCEERGKERFRQLGSEAAGELERKVLKDLLAGEKA